VTLNKLVQKWPVGLSVNNLEWSPLETLIHKSVEHVSQSINIYLTSECHNISLST
jgi:hypothetical protein